LGVRTLNGGMSGNNSIHSFLAMVAKGIPYKPNHIVLMHAINDLGALSKSTSYWDAPKGRSIIQSDDITNSTSLIFNMARHIKDFFVPNLWLKTRHIFEGHMDEWGSFRDKKSDYNNIDKILTEQFTASLRSLVLTSRSWGIEPILMTQFNRFQHDDAFIRAAYEKLPQPVSYDDFVLLYKKTNEIIRKVAKEENVFLIDLDLEIPHSKDYMYDAVHLNTKGSLLVAEKITAALKKRYPSLYH
jgi:lysophospholipase L1-like esterase